MRGQSVGLIVGVAGALVLILVLVVGVWPAIQEALFGAAEGGQCQFSVLLSSMAKAKTFDIVKIAPECKARRMTITMADLDFDQEQAKKEVAAFNANRPPTETLKYSDDSHGYRRWELARIFADNLVTCYQRGFGGKLDITGVNYLSTITREKATYICMNCALVSFDPDVVAEFGGDRIPLKPFLEGALLDKKPIYEMISQGSDPYLRSVTLDAAVVDVTRRQAVMFIGGITATGLTNTEYISSTGIWPYEQITTNLGFQRSTSSGLVTARCSEIIGV